MSSMRSRMNKTSAGHINMFFLFLYFQYRDWFIYSFWLGATDLIQQGSLVWLSSNTSLNYTNWAPYQPYYLNTQGPVCLGIGLLGANLGKWAVTDCNFVYPQAAPDTVCELIFKCP